MKSQKGRDIISSLVIRTKNTYVDRQPQ